MSSVLSTSTMKSPPLEVCVAGSFDGARVSAAICLGPGTAALRLGRGAATCALAATGVSAAAPTRLAPLRKLRRATSGEFRRFGMGVLRAVASNAGLASAQIWFIHQAELLMALNLKSRPAAGTSQDGQGTDGQETCKPICVGAALV